MNTSLQESRRAWDANAEFWDAQMGDESNEFHRTVVRPGVSRLLDVSAGDLILDIACGNGNYSAWMAERGARVVAFDYSEPMIQLARKRQARFSEQIEFFVADATSKDSLMALKRERPFTKAVSNMALMDITDLSALFSCVSELLADQGIFVFSTQHPCFVTLTEQYMTPHSYYGEAISGQPQKQCYYHRSMQDLFSLCFTNHFVIDGFSEACFRNKERPDIIIVRARKTN